MAKKPKNQNNNNEDFQENLTLLDFVSSDYLNSSSLEYSISTLERAIVGIDGLKSSQRKAIFVLSKINGEIKTISCAGRMISDNIYVHGDASASGTLQQLASPVVNNYPLIGKRGGFGTQANPTPASPRYTYVKKTKVTEELILQDMDIVPMKENYDGTTLEPQFFLPLVPISLLGSNGISVGYKSTIMPYALPDIIDNCIRVIDNKKLKEMVPLFKSCGSNDRVDVLGEGKFIAYGKVEIVDSSTLLVTGLPPNMSLDKFIEKLAAFEEDGKIRDFDNDSTDNVEVRVMIPRGLAMSWDEMDAIEYLGLSSKLSENLVVLTETGKVKTYNSPLELIPVYVKHRFKYYIKRYEKRLEDTLRELQYHLLVQACFDNDIMSKVKGFKNRGEMVDFVQVLNKEIEAPDEIVNRIVGFPSYRWTQEYEAQLPIDIQRITNQANDYQELLDNEEAIWSIYKEELQELKKLKFNVE